jgi:cell fate regulator YaaT (PSP1 superfamily)
MPDYVVRYGAMRFLGVFSPVGGREYRRAASVIARTDRGLEAGEILCEAGPDALGQMKDPGAGQILREMTTEDHHELARLQQQARQRFDVCREQVKRLGLKMQLVDMEHLFGGERVVIYYLAESRVDFRELVRVLAGEFQTRIEMRQIGVRDEAKLLADYGDCGCSVCCNTHLVEMPPVSMRMAKLQKATLDPTKISGRCGRLKCCLRYEYESYEQRGSEVRGQRSEVSDHASEDRGQVAEIASHGAEIAGDVQLDPAPQTSSPDPSPPPLTSDPLTSDPLTSDP